MSEVEWIPAGVDIVSLRELEKILTERLGSVRRILRVLRTPTDTKAQRGVARFCQVDRLGQIIEVLREAEKPLTIAEIYQRMKEKDLTLNWASPRENVHHHLHKETARSRGVLRVGWGLYTVNRAETPVPDSETAAERGARSE